MNPLQKYLEQQKDYYNRHLAQDSHKTLAELRLLMKGIPTAGTIEYEFMRWNDYAINLYCRLLLANLEGEIITIVKGIRAYEKHSTTSLFDDWELPDNRQPAPTVDNQVQIADLGPAARPADPADKGEVL